MTAQPDNAALIARLIKTAAARYGEIGALYREAAAALAAAEETRGWLAERFYDAENDTCEPDELSLQVLVERCFRWGDEGYSHAGKEMERADAANSRLHGAVTRAEAAEERAQAAEETFKRNLREGTKELRAERDELKRMQKGTALESDERAEKWMAAEAQVRELREAVRSYVLHGVCGAEWGYEGPSEVCALPKGHNGPHEHEGAVLARSAGRAET